MGTTLTRILEQAGGRRARGTVECTASLRFRTRTRSLSFDRPPTGMFGHPTALIIICIAWKKVEMLGCKLDHPGFYIDVATASENMLPASHCMSLGAGPGTFFSKEAVRAIVGAPGWPGPELIFCVGHGAETQPSFWTMVFAYSLVLASFARGIHRQTMRPVRRLHQYVDTAVALKQRSRLKSLLGTKRGGASRESFGHG